MSSASALQILGTAGNPELISEFLASQPAPIADRNLAVALRTFEAWLNRAPLLNDLAAVTLFGWSSTLIDRGVNAQTVDRYCHSLRRAARAAVAAGLLESVPCMARWRERFTRAKTQPWPASDLTRLFGAISTLRGTVTGIQARLWWKAVCLASIDVQQPAARLLALPGRAFDPAGPELAMGMYVFTIHPVTAAAIAELSTATGARLFPWDLDESASAGGEAYFMLFHDFKRILKRAGLPAGRLNMFRRLCITGEQDPEILEKINWQSPFLLPHGVEESPAALEVSMKPRRRRGNPNWAAAGNISLGYRAKRAKPKDNPDVYIIANTSERTVRRFFEEVYIPRRLAYGSPGTAGAYSATINRLREYCLTDCTLDALSDDLVEGFLAWWRPQRAADSLKRMRGELLAIWRYAWRKGRVETQPRDIDEIRTPKRLAECWSTDEIDRLLTVAGSIEGTVSGIPASLYWPALIMFLIETGLRIGAAMRIQVKNFDADVGWIRAKWDTQKQKADQDLPISPQMVRMLLATQPAGRELLFPWPFRNKETRDIRLRALLKQAGLPCGRRDLWHKFRRTCATFTADVAGEIEAQKQLGHACISTTRKYLDVRKLHRARVVDHPELQRPAWKPQALLGEEHPE